ncbi:MAG: hypothetical protein IT281_07795 [Ignavibacteria bacterium]|nr:hypothetical protein [Ignavibacteria bacterium]MCC7159423.1 hypothetical protein [Ignavibacteria bacterium]
MREYKLILKAIDHFKLNLKGFTVLTEAASGNYKWGPIIASKAGAKVIAYAKSSQYGRAKNIKTDTIKLAKKYKLSNKIEIILKLDSVAFRKADIITNSGFLRPLSPVKLKDCKETAVIPLMWETWEYRKEDLDLSYCNNKGIPVLGTNESVSYLNTISFLGPVVKKLLLEHNIEIHNCTFGIVGNGKFVKAITKSLISDRANCVDVTKFNIRDKKLLRDCDALIFADHESSTRYIGKNAKITGRELKRINPNLLIVHISGNIDPKELSTSGISYCPKQIAPPHFMSISTDYVGPKPLIDLFTAGLKVGELLATARKKGLSYERSIQSSLKNELCQDFSKQQKKMYLS